MEILNKNEWTIWWRGDLREFNSDVSQLYFNQKYYESL